MKKKVFLVISLLILTSFIISCEENANIDGYFEGQGLDQAFTKVYLNYYYLDPNDPEGYSDTRFGRATNFWDDINDLLITTTRNNKKNIKNYSQNIDFAIIDREGYAQYGAGDYFVVNYEEGLNAFIENVIYASYTGDDREEQMNFAQERLRAWLGTINTSPDPNQCVEPVFIYAYEALFSENPSDELYEVISPLFYMPCQQQNGGSTVIMSKNRLPLYNYLDVLDLANPPQFSQVDLFLTVIIMKQIPDY